MSRCNKCLHFNGTSGRQKQIWANKLEDLNSIFPGTQGFVVYTLDANEEAQILLVRQSTGTEKLSNDDVQTCDSLFNAGTLFATTISSQETCSIIHIKGQQYLFSLYSFGERFLVFWSEISDKQPYQETSNQDARVLELCDEIQQTLM